MMSDDCVKSLVSVRRRDDVAARSQHIGVSGNLIGEYAQPWNAVGTEIGTEVGGEIVCEATSCHMGYGQSGALTTIKHQRHSGKSSDQMSLACFNESRLFNHKSPRGNDWATIPAGFVRTLVHA